MLVEAQEVSKSPTQVLPGRILCAAPRCTAIVPRQLELDCLCLLHFTLNVEQSCAEMRRKAISGKASAEYRAEIASYITACGVKLACVATSDLPLPDPMKKRILSTFLSLMSQRESISSNPDDPAHESQPRPRLKEPR